MVALTGLCFCSEGSTQTTVRLSVNSVRMKPISPEALQLVQEEAPNFIQAVQQASLQSGHFQEETAILLTLEAFHDNPMLLYACLWYAESQKVSLTFVPFATE